MAIPAASLFPGRTAIYEHGNYGYPYKGSPRRVSLADRGMLLLVVHITGNSNLPSALAEVQYSARDGSGASFTFCTNRNGTVVQALDPFAHAPWTNGDSNAPNMSLSTIARIHDGNPYSANEFSLATNENVGYEPGYPLTDAQIESNAQLAAWLHLEAKRRGVLIPLERVRIVGHRDINSVTRYRCPTGGDLEALLSRIIVRAREIVAGPQEDDVPLAPPPKITKRLGPEATVRIEGGRTYNLFRYLGRNADGTANLERINNVKWADSTTARALYRAQLDEAATDEGWIVSDWVWVSGRGWVDDVWWSKSPLAEPTLVDPAPEVSDCSAEKATIATQTQRIADLQTSLGQRDAAIVKKNGALDAAIAHEKPHADLSTTLVNARKV